MCALRSQVVNGGFFICVIRLRFCSLEFMGLHPGFERSMMERESSNVWTMNGSFLNTDLTTLEGQFSIVHEIM